MTSCIVALVNLPSNYENPSVISLATHERTQSQINHNEITISRSRRREDADKMVLEPCYLKQKKHRGSGGVRRIRKKIIKLNSTFYGRLDVTGTNGTAPLLKYNIKSCVTSTFNAKN